MFPWTPASESKRRLANAERRLDEPAFALRQVHTGDPLKPTSEIPFSRHLINLDEAGFCPLD
jgi:hypothetical protein